MRAIAVKVRRDEDILSLQYTATCEIGELRLPAKSLEGGPTDGLWRHTCFEAFVRKARAQAYCEFNFSPSSQWAAYQFDSCRAGMAPLVTRRPIITTGEGAGTYWLNATVLLPGMAETPLDVALATVIEEGDGALSYWALAHPSAKPDFHHPDSFTLELP